MTQGFIQVPPDITGGKRVDATELLNENQVTVERQRVEIPDDVNVSGDLLTQMLIEQRIQNLLLAEGLKVNDDIDGLRDELSDIAGLTIPDVREMLTADRTYYVSKTGSDNNDGLSSGTAFLTIATALTAAAALDCGGFTVTVQVGDGTWTVPVRLPSLINGDGILQGNVITPANCLISVTGSCIQWAGTVTTVWVVTGFKLVASAKGILAVGTGSLTGTSGVIEWQAIDFGACTTAHVQAGGFCTAFTVTDYTISGSAASHVRAYNQGFIGLYNATTTATGTINSSTAFAYAFSLGFIEASAPSYAGTYTGSRYLAATNGVIETYGGGANFFPGDAIGTTATGGQYD